MFERAISAKVSAVGALVGLHFAGPVDAEKLFDGLPAASLAVCDVRLFDGTQLVSKTTVLLRDGVIENVWRDVAHPQDTVVHIWSDTDARAAGSIGMRADLLLVEGDPTRDVSASRAIVGVGKKGRHFDHERYRETLPGRP